MLKITSKARHQWQHDIHSKNLVLLNGLHYPQINCIGNLIFDGVGICSRRNEELILNVDVVLGLRDKLKVGNVDAELGVALMAAD